MTCQRNLSSTASPSFISRHFQSSEKSIASSNFARLLLQFCLQCQRYIPEFLSQPVALELIQYKVASKIPYGYFQSSLNLSAPYLSLYDTTFICESDNKGTFKLHINTHTKRDLHLRDLHCPFMTLTNEKCLNNFAKSKYCAVILSAS